MIKVLQMQFMAFMINNVLVIMQKLYSMLWVQRHA